MSVLIFKNRVERKEKKKKKKKIVVLKKYQHQGKKNQQKNISVKSKYICNKRYTLKTFAITST